MFDNSKHKWSRRKFLQTSGAGLITPILAAPMVFTARKAQAAQNIVLVSWGGTYRTAIENALTIPFEKETGIHVILVDTPDMAKVKAQVMTNNVEWDVFDATGPMAMAGSRNGLWDSLDSVQLDRTSLLAPATHDAMPFYGWAGGICWQSKKFPEGKHPKTFPEFFDTTAFPGRRGLKNQANETLEIALLADGVAPDKIYPLDIPRAFRALDRIKPHVGKWISQSPETVTLVTTGEIDFSYTYSSRVKASQAAKQPVDFSFEQTLIGLEYLTMLKNAPNRSSAIKFIEYAMTPERQGALMKELFYIPAQLKAMDLLDENTKKWLPNLKNPKNLIINDQYWASNYDSLTKKFKEWVLS